MPVSDYISVEAEAKPPYGEVCLVLVNGRSDPRPAVYAPYLHEPEDNNRSWGWNGFTVFGVSHWRSVTETLDRLMRELCHPSPDHPK